MLINWKVSSSNLKYNSDIIIQFDNKLVLSSNSVIRIFDSLTMVTIYYDIIHLLCEPHNIHKPIILFIY